jgi:hypothetical protein
LVAAAVDPRTRADHTIQTSRRAGIADVAVLAYHEHALGAGCDAQAAAYIEAGLPNGGTIFGVEIDRNIVSASLRALTASPDVPAMHDGRRPLPVVGLYPNPEEVQSRGAGNAPKATAAVKMSPVARGQADSCTAARKSLFNLFV